MVRACFSLHTVPAFIFSVQFVVSFPFFLFFLQIATVVGFEPYWCPTRPKEGTLRRAFAGSSVFCNGITSVWDFRIGGGILRINRLRQIVIRTQPEFNLGPERLICTCRICSSYVVWFITHRGFRRLIPMYSVEISSQQRSVGSGFGMYKDR